VTGPGPGRSPPPRAGWPPDRHRSPGPRPRCRPRPKGRCWSCPGSRSRCRPAPPAHSSRRDPLPTMTWASSAQSGSLAMSRTIAGAPGQRRPDTGLGQAYLAVLQDLGGLVRGAGPAQLALAVGQQQPGPSAANRCLAAPTTCWRVGARPCSAGQLEEPRMPNGPTSRRRSIPDRLWARGRHHRSDRETSNAARQRPPPGPPAQARPPTSALVCRPGPSATSAVGGLGLHPLRRTRGGGQVGPAPAGLHRQPQAATHPPPQIMAGQSPRCAADPVDAYQRVAERTRFDAAASELAG
jgi:hypothetical protein